MSLTRERLVHQYYEVFQERDRSEMIRFTSQESKALHIIKSLFSL